VGEACSNCSSWREVAERSWSTHTTGNPRARPPANVHQTMATNSSGHQLTKARSQGLAHKARSSRLATAPMPAAPAPAPAAAAGRLSAAIMLTRSRDEVIRVWQ
jgi:hypothetical protein